MKYQKQEVLIRAVVELIQANAYTEAKKILELVDCPEEKREAARLLLTFAEAGFALKKSKVARPPEVEWDEAALPAVVLAAYRALLIIQTISLDDEQS